MSTRTRNINLNAKKRKKLEKIRKYFLHSKLTDYTSSERGIQVIQAGNGEGRYGGAWKSRLSWSETLWSGKWSTSHALPTPHVLFGHGTKLRHSFGLRCLNILVNRFAFWKLRKPLFWDWGWDGTPVDSHSWTESILSFWDPKNFPRNNHCSFQQCLTWILDHIREVIPISGQHYLKIMCVLPIADFETRTGCAHMRIGMLSP